jgi:structural maintenance of chromosome 2
VHPALSLIEYDPVIHPAMEWVFGQTFICKDMETAKKVTFHERILKKSVTLDGDVFDPSGTLSGGKYPTLLSKMCFPWIVFMCSLHNVPIYLVVCLYA